MSTWPPLGTIATDVSTPQFEKKTNMASGIVSLGAGADSPPCLQMKNQLNSGLNSKLQKVKDHLKSQQRVLEERKKEIEILRGWDHVDSGHVLSASHSQLESQQQQSNSHSTDAVTQPTTTPKPSFHPSDAKIPAPPRSKRTTPSSKKRRANKFEAKHRKLLEEEGQVLKQHLVPEGKEKLPALLTIPPPDTKWYEDDEFTPKGSEDTTPLGSEVTVAKEKAEKHVKFEAEAIVLNAALEGELDLLKECIKKVGTEVWASHNA